jgi:hypothetical protein
MLTVPDQYAGTLMKCPLCQSTFQAPALPAKPGPLAPAAAPMAAPPPPGGEDIYGLKDPIAAPPPLSSAPPLGSVSASTGSAPPALNRVSSQPPPPPLGTSTEYHSGFTIPFSPKVLPYVAPACLFLVFVLSFFSWVGYFYGGSGLLTQSAWRAMIGSAYEPNPGKWSTISGLTLDKDKGPPGAVYAPPGMNLLVLLWLPVFLLALAVSVASLVIPLAKVKLPPAVEPHQRYRWGLAGVLALLSLLVLLPVLLLGFSLESSAWAAADAKVAAIKKDNPSSIHDEEEASLVRWREYQALGVHRTTAFRVVLLLELIAAIAAGLAFWLDYRGTGQPIPQLAMRW